MVYIGDLIQEFKNSVRHYQKNFVIKLLSLHDNKTALLAILQITGMVFKRCKTFKDNFKSTLDYRQEISRLIEDSVSKARVITETKMMFKKDLEIDFFGKQRCKDDVIEGCVFDAELKFKSIHKSIDLLDYFQEATGRNINSFGFNIDICRFNEELSTQVELDAFWYNLSSSVRSFISVAEEYLEQDIDLELVVNALLGRTDKVYSIALYNDLEVEKKKMENPDFTNLEEAVYRYIGKPNDKLRRIKR